VSKKYILKVETNWCGEWNEYGVIIKDDENINHYAALFEQTAYENFQFFNGNTAILEELYPDVEEFTEEMTEAADSCEGDYYDWNITEFEGSEEDWEDYDILLNTTE